MDNNILKINKSDLKNLDGLTKIARYIPYKYLKDFVNDKLYFRNCELFDDNNERKRIDRGKYKNSIALEITEKISENTKGKCRAYVSCWTLFNEGENAALWKIFDRKSTGACIVTSVEKLKKQLESNILIGSVIYEENEFSMIFDIEGVASNYPASEFYKISPYFFEKEVRAVFYSKSKEDGLYQKIDFASLIDEVYLSPFANVKNRQRTENLLYKKIEKDKIKPSIISESVKLSK